GSPGRKHLLGHDITHEAGPALSAILLGESDAYQPGLAGTAAKAGIISRPRAAMRLERPSRQLTGQKSSDLASRRLWIGSQSAGPEVEMHGLRQKSLSSVRILHD